MQIEFMSLSTGAFIPSGMTMMFLSQRDSIKDDECNNAHPKNSQ